MYAAILRRHGHGRSRQVRRGRRRQRLRSRLNHELQPRPTPWLVNAAFWGGRADRLEWAETLIPNRVGANAVLRGTGERLTIAAADVAVLLELVDSRVAA